jgi:hypothetical protein
MPKVFGSVRVTFIPGEPFRGTVESWSRPGESHMVDLSERQPLGQCSCEAYSCKIWPEFKKTLKPVRCRHITAFREAYLNRHIRELSPP